MKLKMDINKRYQEIQGFGATGAWWSQFVGAWENLDHILDLLFDKEKGLGLSIYRYNLGGGETTFEDPWRNTENFLDHKGNLDFNKDKVSQTVLKKVSNYDIEEIVFFVNSPPREYTKTKHGFGGIKGTSNLDKSNYDKFVAYCFDVVEHFRNTENINVTHLSPINEATWLWSYQNNQEGCHYTASEVREVIKLFVEEKKRRGLDIELSVPESSDFLNAFIYAEELFLDDEIDKEIDIFDGHSYWTDANKKQAFMEFFTRVYPDKEIAMSEWCEMKEGRDDCINSALILANEIHDDLTILNAVNWQFWLAVSKYDFNDGLIYVNPETKLIDVIPKRYYAFGNFTKFVRPGFVRFDVDQISDGVKISGYIKEDEVVLIFINNEEKSVLVDVDMLSNLEVYVTNENFDLKKVDTKNEILLTHKSITTVKGTLK